MEKDMGMKIENGKRYNSRGGEVFGPMNVPPSSSYWNATVVVAECGRLAWCEGGKYHVGGETDSRDLISEYIESAPIDMTQNRVPWGLLTDEEQAALKSWALSFGAVYRWHSENRKWVGDDPAILDVELDAIYRTVAPTVITEERHDITMLAGHLVTVTLTLHDGKPIGGTVAV